VKLTLDGNFVRRRDLHSHKTKSFYIEAEHAFFIDGFYCTPRAIRLPKPIQMRSREGNGFCDLLQRERCDRRSCRGCQAAKPPARR
jgi:hypothetical protein